jgi:hypothetical protein
MKSPKLKIFLMASVWGVSSAAAFWYGRHSVSAIAATPGHGKAYHDGNQPIYLNGSGKGPMTLQDFLRLKTKPDADALKAWADSLDPSQCAGLLKDLQKMPGGNPRDALIAAMIDSWAARDPKNYLDNSANISSPRERETGVADALKAMAETDPKAAVAWLADNKDAVPSQVLTARYRSAIQGLAASDPQAAFAFVQALDSGSSTTNAQIQRQGLNTIADALASQGQFTDALAMFASLPDDQRGTATAELMTQWAQMSPTDATAYIASLTDPDQRATTETEVVRSWARTDPQAAAAWAAQYDQSVSDSSGQQSGQALADAMRSWSRYDLDGPAQFLNTLTPSPATDQAVATFAAQARNTDPSSAMNWASQITDPTMRERTAGSIALRMLATGDTDSLQAAISSNALTPDQVQWLSNLPTDNQQQLLRMSRRMGANFTTTTTRPAPWAPAQ